MKYRFFQTNCDHLCGNCIITIVIQVKKWYGWVTFHVIDNEFDSAYRELDELKKILRGIW